MWFTVMGRKLAHAQQQNVTHMLNQISAGHLVRFY